jgi:predicted phage terminase large subunit-like protein
MQRLHAGDLSGLILKAVENDEEDWVHLCIPMEYESRRRCVTVVLPQYVDEESDEKPEPWSDPRTVEGDLMWPRRFGTKEIERMKRRLGPYMAAGRLQQSPIPRGGGIIDRDWWQLWDNVEANRYGLAWTDQRKEFPPCELICGSLDTSYGEKDENSYNAMTVWGVWVDRNKNRRAMLMFGWQKHLKLHGALLTPKPNEAKVQFQERQKREWGLVEWVADTCKRYGIKRLIIEDKTRGRDVANELVRQYARENWGIQLIPVSSDKVSRTHSIVPMFTDNMIWAPWTKWSEEVLTDCELFPKGEHNDLHDTVTQFLNWARENEILIMADEMSAALDDQMRYQGNPTDTVANSYGV